MSDKIIRPRDIFIANPKYMDEEEGKTRPLLVVSKHLFQQNCQYAVCVGITSDTKPHAYLVPIPKKEIECGRLDFASQIMCHRIVALNQYALGRNIGRVTPAFYEKIISKLKNDVLGS